MGDFGKGGYGSEYRSPSSDITEDRLYKCSNEAAHLPFFFFSLRLQMHKNPPLTFVDAHLIGVWRFRAEAYCVILLIHLIVPQPVMKTLSI